MVQVADWLVGLETLERSSRRLYVAMAAMAAVLLVLAAMIWFDRLRLAFPPAASWLP
jgi:hypothetical protein